MYAYVLFWVLLVREYEHRSISFKLGLWIKTILLQLFGAMRCTAGAFKFEAPSFPEKREKKRTSCRFKIDNKSGCTMQFRARIRGELK